MYTRGRTLKFVAVLTLVVLTLTGFSTGRGGGKGGKSRSGSSSRHGSGGGCSSSRQDHDSSSSTSGGGSGGSAYGSDADDSYGSGSTYRRRPNHRSTPTPSSAGGRSGLKNADVELVSCASRSRPYATVRVTNPNSRKAGFNVYVEFADDTDETVSVAGPTVSVPAMGSRKLKVRVAPDDGLKDDGLAYMVDHCVVDPSAPAVS
jgi:hypothetical protein